jgi:TraM recognition site of TraD and TraG/Helicase HerA, central domain
LLGHFWRPLGIFLKNAAGECWDRSRACGHGDLMNIYLFPPSREDFLRYGARRHGAEAEAEALPAPALAMARLANSGASELVLDPAGLILFAGELEPSQSFQLDYVRRNGFWGIELALVQIGGNAVTAEQSLQHILTAAAGQKNVSFKQGAPRQPRPLMRRSCLVPCGQPVFATTTATGERRHVLLAPYCLNQSNLTTALQLASDAGVARIGFTFRPRQLSEDERTLVDAAFHRLAGRMEEFDPVLRLQHAVLALWRSRGAGYEIEVSVEAPVSLDARRLDAIALSTFGCGRAPPAAEAAALNLAQVFPAGTPPPWRFWPEAKDLGRARSLVTAEGPAGPGDVILALDEAGDSVSLSADARMRHCAILGGTGFGKSVLIWHMILQDIRAGQGVILIDPAGDLADLVELHIPANRRADVIFVDPGSSENPWGLDLFKTAGIDKEVERNRVANQLVSFFRIMYADIPEAMGPAFEMWFRATIFLLMLAEAKEDRSILHFEDVFADEDFRMKLAKACPDPRVRQKWMGIFDRTSGDYSLENIAPYIINKMENLTGSPLTRRFLSKPPLDLSEAMNQGKIVIFKIAKGVIGDYDTRFLGALILMCIGEAAMGRARLPRSERRPVRLYCDEFQNLATRSSANLLAECRQFGLSIVAANQSLSQLTGTGNAADVAKALLANCATIIAFRLGLADAQELAPFMDIEDFRDLTRLGVGDMIVRRLAGGLPQPAQRLWGLPPVS